MELFRQKEIDRRKLKNFIHTHALKAPLKYKAPFEKLSLIIPCYNHARFLDDTFACILGQTRLPDEVIFADDASTDGTWQKIQKFINEHKHLPIVFKLLGQKRNLGQAENLNQAIGQAQNELLMILNDDDYLMHDAIEKTLKIYNSADGEIYLLGAKTLFFSNEHFLKNMKKKLSDHCISAMPSVRRYTPEDLTAEMKGKGIDMCHSGMSFLKSAWKTVGGYYKNKQKRIIIYSDRDFQMRVAALFPIGAMEEAPLSFWRAGSSVDAGLFS